MSDHYKHISEKAARKASDALSRVKEEQRAEARAKLQERTRLENGVIDSDAIPAATNVSRGQSVVVQ